MLAAFLPGIPFLPLPRGVLKVSTVKISCLPQHPYTADFTLTYAKCQIQESELPT